MRRIFALHSDERGASIIEMALVAPFLATLVIGITDLSLGYSAKLQLEQAAQRAIEKAMNSEKSTSLYKALVDEAVAAAGVKKEAVEVRYWLECDGVSMNSDPATMDKDYGEVCDDGDPYARYVKVRIQKTYDPVFGMKWAGANSDGTYTLTGEAGVRVQ